MPDKYGRETVEEFLARGGAKQELPAGASRLSEVPANLHFCRCGCGGNFDAHKATAKEKNRSPSSIILRNGRISKKKTPFNAGTLP